MNLKQYLDKKRLTYREFAEQLEIQPQSLQSIAYGRRKPSLDLAVKIEELSNGELTPKDLLDYFNNPPKKKPKRKYVKKRIEES